MKIWDPPVKKRNIFKVNSWLHEEKPRKYEVFLQPGVSHPFLGRDWPRRGAYVNRRGVKDWGASSLRRAERPWRHQSCILSDFGPLANAKKCVNMLKYLPPFLTLSQGTSFLVRHFHGMSLYTCRLLKAIHAHLRADAVLNEVNPYLPRRYRITLSR